MVDTQRHLNLFRQSLDDFSPITNESFHRLCSIVKFRKVNKGEDLIRIGQTAKKLYFVCKGLLISLYTTNDGDTHIKNFFLEGTLAASTASMLQVSPSDFSIQCVENGVILEMEFKKYRDLIFKYDDLKNFYIGYLEKKWIIENEKRQIAFATETATERYLTFLEQYPDLENRVPQLQIASYLGVTPTQLSRVRKNLNKS
ncbi:Crp/Fnr family transcriptional regulator [Fulvivirga sp. 29W222]|uniref:Crp/Fnr family transcriptional regulator n=1 Tax=Fulvivirga marina TaxID=2494733 RepID=A0A937KE64_9BACT|nr:Crp/Fnr family transcriptional regulator [Fulvivirga marina]MBL6449402.1 Crp/Fnr family transcriptional regulator [Fulvivirga marina]